MPEGVAGEEVVNGVLQAGQALELLPQAPPQAVEGSARAVLSLTPSLIGQSMAGLDDLLRMPYGCGEQNMIFLAPDIEVLKYLREVGELTVEIRAEAENFVNTGYQRELTFRTSDGGFAVFGGEQGALWLTAFVLSSFSGAREVTTIDERVLADAAAMLLTRQRPDGSFEPDRFLIHTDLAGKTLLNEYATTAYVANALADYNGPAIRQGLERAASYLIVNRTVLEGVNDNGYVLAIAANALVRIAGFQSAAEDFLDRLAELALRDEQGVRWEPFPVEATGWAAQALLALPELDRSNLAEPALDFLMTQRNGQGGFGYSTQDTIVALRALFLAARNVNRSLDLQVTARSGGEALFEIRLNRENYDLLHQVEVPLGSPLSLSAQGQGKANFQMAVRFNREAHRLPPPRNLIFQVEYDSQGIEVDDLMDVIVSLSYTGSKQRTSMVIADIGVPTGFQPVQKTLDRLLEQGIASRIDRAGRKLIFYIDELVSGLPLRFQFQLRALYPVRGAEMVSQAYDYYDPEVHAYRLQEAISILQGPVPSADSVSASQAGGGEVIIIQGSGFLSGGVEVLFNGVAAEWVEVLDDNTLRVRVPNLPPGEVDITVLTNGGSARMADGAPVLTVRPFQLYYPLYPDTEGSFTGIALSNFSDRDATLALRAFRSDGTLLAAATNPAPGRLAQGRQRAQLGHELFGFQAGTLSQPGWIELSSDNAKIASFFQFGGPGSLDGAAAFRGTARQFWLAGIRQDPQALGGSRAETTLTLANPFDEPAVLELLLVENASGGRIEHRRQRELGPRASLTESIEEIFATAVLPSPAYLQVTVTQGRGAVGFGRIDLPEAGTVVGLPVLRDVDGTVAYSAQVASGQRIFTSLDLINTSDSPRRVTLSLIAEDGTLAADPVELQIAAAGALRRDLAGLFGLSGDINASLRMESDGPGVLGSLLFGSPDGANAAALPLQTQAFTRAVFPHFGDGPGFLTGLALLNPGAHPAILDVRIIAPSGSFLGKSRLMLAPGQRLARQLPELVPSSAGRMGGYLIIESSRPLIAQQLFGATRLDLLSAVPPTVIR